MAGVVFRSSVSVVLFNPLIRVMHGSRKVEILNMVVIAETIWSGVVSVKAKTKEN